VRRAGTAAVCLLAAAMAVAVQPPAPGTLTGAEGLARAHDAALDADFAEAERRREAACPPAPAPACLLLGALVTWWRIQLDPDDLRHDEEFVHRVEAALEAAGRWTAEEPDDAEAWFYLGAGHGARAQWKALRGDRLGAAREGRAIKRALDRALTLDPGLDDARFGLGLYQYYAGTAPRVLRMLRWLLLLPGGNRAAGLQLIERAHRAGGLVSSEAAYQLHLIYLWYEVRFSEARVLVETLVARYPRSPLFPQLVASIDDVYLNDPAESRRGWEALLAAAHAERVNVPHLAEARAQMALAAHLDRLDESDRAIAHLDALLDLPALPYGVEAQALLARGRAHDRLGDREAAEADYRRAISAAPAGDPGGVRAAAARAPREAPAAARARAYRLALEGWRALERGDTARAWERLDEAWRLDPRNPVTRYRRARVLLARGEAGEAFTELDHVLAMRPIAPPATRIAALMDAAALAEQFAQPSRAHALFTQAARVDGADRRLRDRAAREAARLDPPVR
jgi:tetratricopeptide (TPR) repeat protein